MLAIVDDFSRFSWTYFLKHKNDAFHEFTSFCKMIQNQKSTTIITIRSDHGGEFENDLFSDFCDKNGIFHEFSFPRTPQQNGVVERKIRLFRNVLEHYYVIQNFLSIFGLKPLHVHVMF